jgi:hypothetical protein
MKLYKKHSLNRAAVLVLVIVNLAFAGSATVKAQGKGASIGGRPQTVERVLMERRAMPGKAPRDLKPQPRAKLKPRKPARPFNPDKERHRAHKRCVDDCNRAHKNAIRACRGERGRTRAACERAANQAHRDCVRGCPR